MQLTRQRKEALVDELAQKMEDNPVVGVLDMHSLPAKQLQEIKKELVGDVDIQMTRKTLIARALDQADREDITDLKETDAIQPALLFTDTNPFSLFQLIQAKKTSAAASGGETAPADVVIQDGMTDLGPGPMLGKIQALGANTSVEDGNIKIENSAVAVEAGEVIDADTAEVLNALGIEPLEVGLDLKLVYENGDVFGRDVLDIDIETYRSDLKAAASGAFNLAVNAGVLTPETAPHVLQQAIRKARNLAVNGGIIAEDVIEDLLRKAAGEASALDGQVDWDAAPVEAADAEDDAEDADDEQEPDEDGEAGEASEGPGETQEDADEDDDDTADADTEDDDADDNDVTDEASEQTEDEDAKGGDN